MPASPRPARSARPRGRAQAAALTAALLAVVASGCSQPEAEPDAGASPSTQTPAKVSASSQAPAEAGASTQTLADGSGFLVGAPTNVFMQAAVSGRLSLIGENCIGLETPSSGQNNALIFDHGTRPSEDGSGIVLPDGLEIKLGDYVSGGGGSTTLDQAPNAFDLWPQTPSGCPQAAYLTTINDVRLGEAPQG